MEPGHSLATYEIIALLGAGGMGQVYRARDTRLNREVAIKVLPPEFSENPVRLARLQTEARSLAAMKHPNIATVHSYEEADGVHFLVMELVEGQTLASFLLHRPSVKDALTICSQIAEGLEAAHEKGIIHRDLKPSNVMIGRHLGVKIVDFGLAKRLGLPGLDTEPGSPTNDLEPTASHALLGTVPYMSPEQIRSEQVNERTDIWAFGCVLFETLTGKRAFGRPSFAETVTAILNSEPDWQSLPRSTPPTVQFLQRRCLSKDVRHRLQHIGDARVAIEDSQSETGEAVSGSSRPANTKRLHLGATARAVLLIALALIGVVAWITLRPSPRVVGTTRTLEVWLPDDQRLVSPPVLSPDGLRLAYAAAPREIGPEATGSDGTDATTRLFLRSTVTGASQAIPHTEGALHPFFSPNGEWLGFFASGELKKVSLRGGEPVSLCDARLASSAAWGPDNRIYFSPSTDKTLAWVSASGGTPELLPTPKGAPLGLDSPSVLPRRTGLLLRVFSGVQASPIGVLSLETGRLVTLRERGIAPRYVSTGHIVYIRGGSLVSVPFDLETLTVTGSETPVIDGVAEYTVADDGTLVYTAGEPSAERELVWVDRAGLQVSPVLPAGRYGTFKLSPEGGRLAIEIEGAKTDVWVFDLHKGARLRLTHVGRNGAATWTPDGERVVFASDRDGTYGLYWKRADGTGEDEPLLPAGHVPAWGSWSPDGSTYAFTQMRAGQPDIWILSRTGDGKAFPFLDSPSSEWGPGFSPDGKWIVYCSDESGRFEIYVRPSPGRAGGRQAVSLLGGEEPLWSRNGDELFYRSGSQWMVVAVKSSDPLRLGDPKPLFSGNYLDGSGISYDVSPDGRRFLLLKTSRGERRPNRLVVVLNWHRLLEFQSH